MRGFQRIKKRSERSKSETTGADNAARTKWLRSQLIRKFGGRCVQCHEEVILSDEHHPRYATIDHTIPLSKGGSDHISNMALMCKECNQRKGDNP